MTQLLGLQLISKYRAELMGGATIGVLVGHIIAFGNFDVPVLDTIAHGIHTPGFLFLSGFGLFYSLSKDSNAKEFYKRRFWRFLLPYVLISLPFLCRSILTGNFEFGNFLLRLSTLNFWINGNTDGMWYIAVSLVLYIITLPIYYWISNAYVDRLLLIITGVIALNYGIEYVSEEYWSKISIGLKYAHMYFGGMLTAYLAKNKSLPQELIVTATAVLTMAYVASLFCNVTHLVYFETLVTILFYIALLICVLQILDYQKIGFLSVCLSWFGKYSLELYLLQINKTLFKLQKI